MELLRAHVHAQDRPAHIGDLLNIRVVSIEEGSVVFELDAEPRFANYNRTLHGGLYATLLDSAMGCAAQSALAAGLTCTALEIKVNFVRTVPVDGRRLVAVGKVIHLGRQIVTVEGTVRDNEDRIVAHGTSTCLVTPAAL
ncbi:PaaI family thioesterase [Actinoplanes utahensis]|uniref:PaaI family thioesterase n=1 Tax=Actinoplanes utahensis TaxID=1869 RepID=UPI000AF8E8C2|nr:PaaI family thioesterase [Actinoplanes utahensis]